MTRDNSVETVVMNQVWIGQLTCSLLDCCGLTLLRIITWELVGDFGWGKYEEECFGCLYWIYVGSLAALAMHDYVEDKIKLDFTI